MSERGNKLTVQQIREMRDAAAKAPQAYSIPVHPDSILGIALGVTLRLSTGETVRITKQQWLSFLQKLYWDSCPVVKRATPVTKSVAFANPHDTNCQYHD